MIQFDRNVNKSELLSFNMDISSYARVRLDSSWRADKVPTPYNRVYAPLKGCGEVRVNGRVTLLRPGSLYLIPAGSDFSYRCDDFLEKIYLHVTFTLPDGRDLCASLSECAVFEGRENTVDELDGLLTVREPERSLRLHALLTALIAPLSASLAPPAAYSPLVTQALEYIRDHFRERPSEAELARALYVSPDTLRKTFRRETGVPLIRYENEQCLRQAEREVRTTTLPIKEISRRAGFTDPLYFSRVFAAHYGSSPQKYRALPRT